MEGNVSADYEAVIALALRGQAGHEEGAGELGVGRKEPILPLPAGSGFFYFA